MSSTAQPWRFASRRGNKTKQNKTKQKRFWRTRELRFSKPSARAVQRIACRFLETRDINHARRNKTLLVCTYANFVKVIYLYLLLHFDGTFDDMFQALFFSSRFSLFYSPASPSSAPPFPA